MFETEFEELDKEFAAAMIEKEDRYTTALLAVFGTKEPPFTRKEIMDISEINARADHLTILLTLGANPMDRAMIALHQELKRKQQEIAYKNKN